MPYSTYSQDLRLLLPETVWLEPEHFSLAQQTSSQTTNPKDSWQIYLNTLALLGFEVWLSERLSGKLITRDTDSIATAGNLKIGEYKFCAIATEHLLDEIANIPQQIIENPELAAHFYVLIEVLEEDEEIVIRGFLAHNQLTEIKNNLELSARENSYQLPLSLFDSEPNHLLFYQRYLEASEFGVPLVDVRETQGTGFTENLSNFVDTTTTKLSQWLQGVIDEDWQTIDALSNPELSLAFSTRNIDTAIKKAKIIDLEINSENQKFALLVNISSDKSSAISDDKTQGKISVLIQLYPVGGDKFLPKDIKLSLISKAGKNLQEVTSIIQDNYIQLKLFRGKIGKKFSIQISLGDARVDENFEF